jgi:hypothetical protein
MLSILVVRINIANVKNLMFYICFIFNIFLILLFKNYLKKNSFDLLKCFKAVKFLLSYLNEIRKFTCFSSKKKRKFTCKICQKIVNEFTLSPLSSAVGSDIVLLEGGLKIKFRLWKCEVCGLSCVCETVSIVLRTSSEKKDDCTFALSAG